MRLASGVQGNFFPPSSFISFSFSRCAQKEQEKKLCVCLKEHVPASELSQVGNSQNRTMCEDARLSQKRVAAEESKGGVVAEERVWMHRRGGMCGKAACT